MTQPQTSGMPKSSCRRDGRTDDFSEIARRNRQLADDPEKPDGRLGVMIAAGLREIAPRGDTELDAQMLEQDRHEVRDHDDREQRVAKLRATRQIGRPIAGVHVADRDEKTRAGEGGHFAPKRALPRHDDTAVHFRKRDHAGFSAPACFGGAFESDVGRNRRVRHRRSGRAG